MNATTDWLARFLSRGYNSEEARDGVSASFEYLHRKQIPEPNTEICLETMMYCMANIQKCDMREWVGDRFAKAQGVSSCSRRSRSHSNEAGRRDVVRSFWCAAFDEFVEAAR
jgi:hypothetical protein